MTNKGLLDLQNLSLPQRLFAAALFLTFNGIGVHAQTTPTAKPANALTTTPMAYKKRITVPSGGGGWDWMAVDARKHRLLATHKGKNSVELLDLDDEKTVVSLPVGTAQGIGIDEKENKYYFGDADEKKIVVVDRNTLKVLREISVTGPVDAIGFDPKRGLIFADEDDGKQVWVIDTKTDRIVGSVSISGAPEYVEYDPVTDKLYQNIKANDTVQIIDPDNKQVIGEWKTAPATGPHGLAIDGKNGVLFSAGKNGVLSILDLKSGKVKTSLSIGIGVDQIAYDADRKRIYCACKNTLSVAERTKDGSYRKVGDYALPTGVHTLAIDNKTHAVWTCYSDANGGYLEKYQP